MVEYLRLEERIAKSWPDLDKTMAWFDGEEWSARRMFGLVEENVKQLKAAGFSAGDRIVTLLANSPAFYALCIAAWKLKGAVATLNAMAGPQALAAFIKHTMPSVIVGAPALKAHAAAFGKLPIPLVFLDSKSALPEFKALPSVKTPEDVAMIFYTSGTTGTPKGVPLTHANIGADLDNVLAQVCPDIMECAMLNVLPNFHTLGCIVSGLMPMLVGIKTVILENFMPVEKTVRAIDEGGANFFTTVPTLLHFLCGAAAKSGWRPKGMKYIISGGDRLLPQLRARVEQMFGCTLIEGYGLTECSPILACQVEGSPHSSVGHFLKDIEYKLCDLEGNAVDAKEGVLWVKGPNVMGAYLNAPQITAEKIKDGWFNTGDMVSIDDNGDVTVQERVSDLIIVGGFNVYPQEVEAVLNTHPSVKESAAVGVSRSVTGQMVRAFVIMKEGMDSTSAELVAWCRERLPHYKVPRSIKTVTDFPRNALGKVLRRKLREEQEGEEK